MGGSGGSKKEKNNRKEKAGPYIFIIKSFIDLLCMFMRVLCLCVWAMEVTGQIVGFSSLLPCRPHVDPEIKRRWPGRDKHIYPWS